MSAPTASDGPRSAEPVADRTASTTWTRVLWQNSTLAFVLAALVAVVLHETSHAVAAVVQGGAPVLYPFEVDNPGPHSTGTQIATAATGPLFSLVLGVLVLASTRNAGRGFGRLFALWFGFIAAENFMGYLVISPFANAGDTGRVLDLLNAPGWVAVICCVLGVAGILTLSWLFLRQVSRYAPGADELRAIGLLAWVASTIITVARTLAEVPLTGIEGPQIPVVVAGAVATGIFAPIMTPFYRRVRMDHERLSLRRPIGPAVLTAVLIALDLAVLTRGITL